MKKRFFIWLPILLLSSFLNGLAQTKPVISFLPKDTILLQLTQQLRMVKHDTNQLIILTQIVKQCTDLHQFETAHAYVQQGYQLALHSQNPLLLGRFYTNIGIYYQDSAKYPEVINTLKKAIHYLQQTNQKNEIARTMYMLARAYSHRDMIVQEFDQVTQNLAYAKQTNFHEFDIKNYALLYTSYIGSNQKEKAFDVLQTMENIAQQSKNINDLYLTYANLGEWYDLQNQYSKGLPYHRKALFGILKQGNVNVDYVSQSYYNIVNNLFQQDRLSEAQIVLNQAIRLNKNAGILLPGNLFKMQALILERQHRLTEAHQWLNKTLPNFRQANPTELVAVLEILIRIQQKRGEYHDAFLMLKEQKRINDKLQQVNKHKALANLEAQAELDKQTQNVILLKKNVAINQLELIRTHQQQFLISGLAIGSLLLAIGGAYIAKKARTHVRTLQRQTDQIRLQAQRLQELNDVKDKLFSVIGHDLRVPIMHLQTSLKQLNQPSIDQQRFSQQVTQLKRSVNAIYSTLDNLLHWSALQQNLLVTRPTLVNLDILIQQVLLLFEPIITQKSLDVEQDRGPLWAWVDETQAQIILRNIIHNAFKFTPVGGRIDITYQTLSQESFVQVKDTGIGMPTVEKSQPMQGTGLGLIVTREFLALNRARLTIISPPDEGTIVQLFFLRAIPSGTHDSRTCMYA